jgi:hypothetical protein
MANATAVLIYETESPITFNCASAAAFEKGDCVTLTGATANLVVAITSADNDIFGGIVAEEKIANVGTTVSLYRRGYFKIEVGSAGATVGKGAVISAKNEFTDYTTLDDEKGISWGHFLESGTDGQFVAMELGAT